ncbi:uncharacterized protein B0H18DRAFT_971036 [Fomitopsis serialis]|uniref:uncharacterized protein n=1 Tax=Fomitopsis serialis TaxID=139415 RepID=UPI00200732A6|nr:uncharacterized protein B0H18DRAFT_971036 [Neoantrodia serialis]KAH9937521.1 hypothetical protein B0H18DRAFT_971036 [Neoantrodia serialis]
MATQLGTELLAQICGKLLDDVDGQQAVPALARTCRAFFEPAVDTIWRGVTSLALLAFLLPSDAWKIGDKPKRNRIISFQRVLLPSDFARFQVYGHRVRAFGAYNGSIYRLGRKYKLSRGALAALYEARPTPPLFPNLDWADLNQDLAPYVSMLYCPHIRAVTIRMFIARGEDPKTQALLRIPTDCPQLTSLTIYCNPLDKQVSDMMKKAVSALPNLTLFALHEAPISIATLEVLANFANLAHLRIALHKDSDPSGVSTNSDSKVLGFNSLRELSLNVNTLEHATHFLSCVTSPRLVMLVISYDTLATAHETEALFKEIESHLKLCSLQVSIRPGTPNNLPLDLPSRTLTDITLLPLLVLRSLRVLTLHGFPIDINDVMLEAMAVAWPELSRFSLGVDMRWGAELPPRATILALIPFIRHCPKIWSIGYRMKTDVLSRDGDPLLGFSRIGKGVVTNKEMEFNIGDSPIHDPIEVASFLSDICPGLWYIGSLWRDGNDVDEDEEGGEEDDDDGEMYGRWDMVTQYLPHFAKVRMQERNCP